MDTAAVPLHVLDTDVDVVVSGQGAQDFASVVAQRWHLAAVDRPGGAARVIVDAEIDDGSDPRVVLQRLTQHVTRAVIAERTGDLLMLHAGALAHPETGAAIVFVAPGGTGKSTTCRVQGPGRAYLTDETVGIRRDGTIAPYLKPISTRRVDWSGIKDEVAPGELGLAGPRVPARVAGIVLLRREEGRVGPPDVGHLDTLEALTDIAPETSGFMRTDRPLTWLAGLLESTGGARRVTYGAADQLESLVDEVVGGSR